MLHKYTIIGPTGRAQLTVQDLTGDGVPERKRRPHVDFIVHLLPRRAHRSTSFRSAGDRAYFGPDLATALLHISAWTGLADVPVPAAVRRCAERAAA